MLPNVGGVDFHAFSFENQIFTFSDISSGGVTLATVVQNPGTCDN